MNTNQSTKNQIQTLVNAYKADVKKHGLGEEAYKWELLQQFRGQLNLDAVFLETELKRINYSNLIYHTGKSVMFHLAKDRTEPYRTCLKAFFDENLPLEQRIIDFTTNTLKIYRELEPKLQHHHDERTMATLLTYFNPEKYAFYKYSFYKEYCTKLGLPLAKKNKKYIHYLELVNQFIEEFIKPDEELISIIKKEIPTTAFQDANYLLLAQDILYRTLNDKLTKTDSVEAKPKMDKKNSITNNTASIALNQILFGPPGTGKTYYTIDLSVQIAAPNEYQLDNHSHNKTVYDRLLKEKQIQFVTFHQSMSYEDFIEGFKPLKNKDDLKYDVENGIFKEIARAAKSGTSGAIQTQKRQNFKNKDFHKMSLGGKNKPEIHQWCIENNVISLGYGDENDFTLYKKKKDWSAFRNTYKKDFPVLVQESRYNIQAMYSFMHTMKKGDVVIITKGNHVLDAVGIIKSDYYFDDNKEIEYCHFRDVEWIITEMDAVPNRFVSKNISQQTVYQVDNKNIILEAFEGLVQKEEKKEDKNFVLIIDEINRGNISQIFGELITLIEKDKRAGQKEALSTQLPYSKTSFSVPSNLYIIGTMNTADRSVEAMDTALRRRFSFVPMFPKPALLAAANNNLADIDLPKLLQTINQRIEKLLNKDHTIGHSYFIKIEEAEEPLKALKEIFENKIIPLLQEYFYNDYENIGMVLGNQFVEKVINKDIKFGRGFGSSRRNHLEKPIYIFTPSSSWTSTTFKSIYDNE